MTVSREDVVLKKKRWYYSSLYLSKRLSKINGLKINFLMIFYEFLFFLYKMKIIRASNYILTSIIKYMWREINIFFINMINDSYFWQIQDFFEVF